MKTLTDTLESVADLPRIYLKLIAGLAWLLPFLSKLYREAGADGAAL